MKAIEESLDHLRPWMPWAACEPEPIEKKARRLAGFQRRFERGSDMIYGAFDPDGTTVLGGFGLHRRIGDGAVEMGYWIHVDHVGQGLATEGAAALTRVGFEVEHRGRIEIHCDPENLPSAAIARNLGYDHQVTVAGCVTAPGMTPRDTMIWTMRRDRYPTSTAQQQPADWSLQA